MTVVPDAIGRYEPVEDDPTGIEFTEGGRA